MNESFKAIIFLIIYIAVIFVFLNIARNIRSLRLKNISKKFNLEYRKKFSLFNLSYSNEACFNLIEGLIAGHKIKFYDSVNGKEAFTKQDMDLDKYSILIIDDVQKIQTKKDFLKIKILKNELSKLQ